MRLPRHRANIVGSLHKVVPANRPVVIMTTHCRRSANDCCNAATPAVIRGRMRSAASSGRTSVIHTKLHSSSLRGTICIDAPWCSKSLFITRLSCRSVQRQNPTAQAPRHKTGYLPRCLSVAVRYGQTCNPPSLSTIRLRPPTSDDLGNLAVTQRKPPTAAGRNHCGPPECAHEI